MPLLTSLFSSQEKGDSFQFDSILELSSLWLIQTSVHIAAPPLSSSHVACLAIFASTRAFKTIFSKGEKRSYWTTGASKSRPSVSSLLKKYMFSDLKFSFSCILLLGFEVYPKVKVRGEEEEQDDPLRLQEEKNSLLLRIFESISLQNHCTPGTCFYYNDLLIDY